MDRYTSIESPIGTLYLCSDGEALTGLYMDMPAGPPMAIRDCIEDAASSPLPQAARQLTEYFSGTRRHFDLPLRLHGTDFQRRVWDALKQIPYGATMSYGELARLIDKPGASRAVGLANGANPISLLVPCHRIIGANGSLTGYGGGMERKLWLLCHEGLH